MRNILLMLMLAAGSAGHAGSMTTAMSCAEAYNLVQERGTVKVTTARHGSGHLVAHEGLCGAGERAEPAWVPTLDEPQCFVGYACSLSPETR